ncbi:type I-PGING CRISPR-associated protein Cas7/Csp1 [Flammeovirga aprica]|uniref:Type I-PGING CRISPR-associated protein Cas7/Csp1 n=1 Tax=Flammeovirga aprica JL-4 TaxID=694437 RepID=A0A7X9P1M5_9BACT|nr:type I-PGING CRISPR-associated protein Cas7/Csp1 [Flammeovirga aprica]NME67357.1 type I-PGING CRISPR-associated protein Cas7/Csp1 [Flammeovirga aprica JL-4]
MEIQGIFISTLVPMDNHMANGGEKLLGNASSVKQRPDGKVYISGQMQRHVLFSAIDRLNEAEKKSNSGPICGEVDVKDTHVSNGDGISDQIEKDLRADMGGFMHPSRGDYSGRRTSPISVTPAVAIKESEIGRDLLVRLKQSTEEASRDQALATKEFSQGDMMLMNFYLDLGALSITKRFSYDNEYHVGTDYMKHVKEAERKRRVKLFIEATRSLNEYANQARNSVSGEPEQVLIVFDTKHSRKASRYFQGNETLKKNIIDEIQKRDAFVVVGNDSEGEKSVFQAYEDALSTLNDAVLFDPSGISDDQVVPFARVFETE